MKSPEKQWIKKVDAVMILVMRRFLRNFGLSEKFLSGTRNKPQKYLEHSHM